MAKQTVGIGSSANDGTGDTLRAGADKINDNFNEIYAALGNSSNVLTDIIDSNGLFDVSSGANKIVFLLCSFKRFTKCFHIPWRCGACACNCGAVFRARRELDKIK